MSFIQITHIGFFDSADADALSLKLIFGSLPLLAIGSVCATLGI
jgi:hypothetical protein